MVRSRGDGHAWATREDLRIAIVTRNVAEPVPGVRIAPEALTSRSIFAAGPELLCGSEGGIKDVKATREAVRHVNHPVLRDEQVVELYGRAASRGFRDK